MLRSIYDMWGTGIRIFVRVCNWNVYSHRIRVDVCIHVYMTYIQCVYTIHCVTQYLRYVGDWDSVVCGMCIDMHVHMYM